MTEEKQESKSKIATTSNFRKTLLVILAVFLTFAGPTYVVYALLNALEIDYIISMVFGFALFVVGALLIWYLIKNKIVS